MVAGWAMVDSACGAAGGGEDEFVRDVEVDSMRSSSCSADFDLLLPRKGVDEPRVSHWTDGRPDPSPELASSPSPAHDVLTPQITLRYSQQRHVVVIFLVVLCSYGFGSVALLVYEDVHSIAVMRGGRRHTDSSGCRGRHHV